LDALQFVLTASIACVSIFGIHFAWKPLFDYLTPNSYKFKIFGFIFR